MNKKKKGFLRKRRRDLALIFLACVCYSLVFQIASLSLEEYGLKTDERASELKEEEKLTVKCLLVLGFVFGVYKEEESCKFPLWEGGFA